MGKECGTWVSRHLWGRGNTSPLKTTAWEGWGGGNTSPLKMTAWEGWGGGNVTPKNDCVGG